MSWSIVSNAALRPSKTSNEMQPFLTQEVNCNFNKCSFKDDSVLTSESNMILFWHQTLDDVFLYQPWDYSFLISDLTWFCSAIRPEVNLFWDQALDYSVLTSDLILLDSEIRPDLILLRSDLRWLCSERLDPSWFWPDIRPKVIWDQTWGNYVLKSDLNWFCPEIRPNVIWDQTWGDSSFKSDPDLGQSLA